MTITRAQWSNAEESAVNAVYADGRNCWGITRERRSWADVEAFAAGGGVIAAYVDPATTPEAVAARERREREAKTARDATALSAILLPVMANETPLDDVTLHALAEAVPDVFDAWAAGATYDEGARLMHEGALYVVKTNVTAQAHQPPGSEGMLAVYRPVSPTPEASGTFDDPIFFVGGMDTFAGLYYRHNGATWRCAQGASPCIDLYAPSDALPALWVRA